jgi:uncharacterized protein (TIGR02147 family)
MLNMESNSISELLGTEFSRRKLRNTSYSLRAFARDLHLSPSRLSEVMSGKEGLSEKTVDGIAATLSKKPLERKFIKDLVLSEFSRNEKVREAARERVEETRKAESFRRMKEDQFRVISDWYHGAILELIQVEGFQDDPKWIGRKLGIPATTAASALTRLENLGLVERKKEGGWVAKTEAYSAFSEIPSSAIRKFHHQILSMHADSLREDPMLDRQFLSMILAIPRSRLQEFQEEMNKFATQFWQKIENEPKDDLYSLSLQLCPVRNRRPEGD